MFCDNGKVGYENVKDAHIAAANLGKHDKRHKYDVYKCNECGTYHVHTAGKKVLRTPKKLNKYPIKYTPTVSDENPIAKKENKKKKRYFDGRKKK